MNKHFLFCCGILGLACLFVFCGDDKGTNDDDDDDTTTTVIDHTVRGTWRFSFLSNSWVPKSIFFSIIIRDSSNNTIDSSFTFTAIEDPDKMIYQHSGNWEISGDSLLLHGDSCLTIDKSSNVLVQAHDSTTNKTISLDTTGTYNLIWQAKIPLEKYADVWRSISHNTDFSDLLMGLIPQFEKDTSTSY